MLQVTAWIPLLNATTRNGCMQVIRGGHRAGKTCKHSCCVGGTWCVTVICPTAAVLEAGACKFPTEISSQAGIPAWLPKQAFLQRLTLVMSTDGFAAWVSLLTRGPA